MRTNCMSKSSQNCQKFHFFRARKELSIKVSGLMTDSTWHNYIFLDLVWSHSYNWLCYSVDETKICVNFLIQLTKPATSRQIKLTSLFWSIRTVSTNWYPWYAWISNLFAESNKTIKYYHLLFEIIQISEYHRKNKVHCMNLVEQ